MEKDFQEWKEKEKMALEQRRKLSGQLDILEKATSLIKMLVGGIFVTTTLLTGIYMNISNRLTLLEERLSQLTHRVAELRVQVLEYTKDSKRGGE